MTMSYKELKVGDKFVVLSNGKKCIKTKDGVVSLENGKRMLMFSTTEVSKLSGEQEDIYEDCKKASGN